MGDKSHRCVCIKSHSLTSLLIKHLVSWHVNMKEFIPGFTLITGYTETDSDFSAAQENNSVLQSSLSFVESVVYLVAAADMTEFRIRANYG